MKKILNKYKDNSLKKKTIQKHVQIILLSYIRNITSKIPSAIFYQFHERILRERERKRKFLFPRWINIFNFHHESDIIPIKILYAHVQTREIRFYSIGRRRRNKMENIEARVRIYFTLRAYARRVRTYIYSHVRVLRGRYSCVGV